MWTVVRYRVKFKQTWVRYLLEALKSLHSQTRMGAVALIASELTESPLPRGRGLGDGRRRETTITTQTVFTEKPRKCDVHICGCGGDGRIISWTRFRHRSRWRCLANEISLKAERNVVLLVHQLFGSTVLFGCAHLRLNRMLSNN